jgi:dihydrofolate reductase
MRRIVVSEFVTLDGVAEEPGKWSFPFWNEEISKFKFDELFSSDALLLGRVTYQGFAAAWPSMKDEAGYAKRMNSFPKHVVTRTLEKLEWNNSHLITGNIEKEVSVLKQQSGQDLLIFGSGRLVNALMQYDMIDEYRFLVYPIILGNGKRLFNDASKSGVKLVETKTFGSGVVLLRYQTNRK